MVERDEQNEFKLVKILGTDPFMNRDPLAEQAGLNLYDYVGNNPISRIDSLGLAPGDQWYGYNDPAFRDWYHRDYKPNNLLPGEDADQDTMDNAYDEWLAEGKPDLRKGHREPCDNNDETPPEPSPDQNNNNTTPPIIPIWFWEGLEATGVEAGEIIIVLSPAGV